MRKKVDIFLSIAYLGSSIVVSLASIGAIVYCVVTAKWLPAIFVLLARKDVIRGMERESRRFVRLAKEES